MNDGTGYAVATGEHKTNAYLTGNCSGGFFNGEFTACATEIFAEGTENQKQLWNSTSYQCLSGIRIQNLFCFSITSFNKLL